MWTLHLDLLLAYIQSVLSLGLLASLAGAALSVGWCLWSMNLLRSDLPFLYLHERGVQLEPRAFGCASFGQARRMGRVRLPAIRLAVKRFRYFYRLQKNDERQCEAFLDGDLLQGGAKKKKREVDPLEVLRLVQPQLGRYAAVAYESECASWWDWSPRYKAQT